MEKVGVELVALNKETFLSSLKEAQNGVDSFVKVAGGAGGSLEAFNTALKNISSSIAGLKGLDGAIKPVSAALDTMATSSVSSVDKVGKIHGAANNAEGGARSLAGAVGGAAKGLMDLGKDAAGAAVDGLGKVAGAASHAVGGLVDIAAKAAEAGGHFALDFAKTSVGAAMEFDQKISEVAAVSGATADELQQMNDKALELGAKFPVSASDAADAMGELAKAGLTAKEAIAASDGVVQLASATHLDMAKSAGILTVALTGFGLSADKAGHVTDLLAQTANASAVDVTDLGETFKYVAPVAKSAGFSIEDMSVAIGLMGNAGIKGSSAGTSLRSVITRMAAPTKDSAAAMEALGFKMTDASGKVRPFNDIMLELRDKFSKLDQVQKIDLAKKLAGQNAFTGLLAVVDASPEKFDQMRQAIDHADGAGADMAATMNDNLAGAVENMKGSIETLQIKLGKALSPALKIAANAVADLANAAGPLADKFAKLIAPTIDKVSARLAEFKMGLSGNYRLPDGEMISTPFTKLGEIIANVERKLPGIITAVQPIVKTFLDLSGAISPVRIAFEAFTGYLNGGFMGAVTAVEGGVQRAASVFGVDLSGAFTTINNIITTVLVPAFNTVVTFVTTQLLPAISTFATNAANFFNTVLLPAIMSFGNWIATNIGPIVTSMATTFETVVLPALLNFGNFIITDVVPKLMELGTWIGQNIVPLLEKLAGFVAGTVVPVIGQFVAVILGDVIPTLTNWFSVIATVLAPVIEKLVGFITGSVLPALQQIGQFLTGTVFPAFSQVASFVNANVMPTLKTLAGFLGGTLSTAFDVIGTVAKGVWNAISNVVQTAWGVLKGIFDTISAVLRGDMTGAFNGIKETVGAAFDGVKNAISNAWDTISGIWKSMVSGIGELGKGISNQLGDVVDWFIQLPGKIMDAIAGLPGKMLSAGGDAINGFIKGFSNIHIPLPHFNITMGEGPFGVPMPNVSVNWYAKGGIFNAPTVAGIGEAGPEAVLPLKRLVPMLSAALIQANADVAGGLNGMVSPPASPRQLTAMSIANSTTDARQFNLQVNSTAPANDIAQQFYILEAMTL